MKSGTDEVPFLSVHQLAEDERRTHCRFRNGVTVRCRTETGVSLNGRAFNLSLSGAAVLFLSDRKPPKIVSILFRCKGRKTVRINATPVRVRRNGRIWLVGCAFDRPLSADEFKLLM
jgi:hypothetical protein